MSLINSNIFKAMPRSEMPEEAKMLLRIEELTIVYRLKDGEYADSEDITILISHISDVARAMKGLRNYPEIDSFFRASELIGIPLPPRSAFDRIVKKVIAAIKKEGYFEHRS